ncbi:hypothetical protein [Pyrococcus kukulkanii]|uniref:hypothetical protein n=1 Tax=Pyrococcus kukulkanii TaxID=1609559 RepID=UPI00356A60A2
MDRELLYVYDEEKGEWKRVDDRTAKLLRTAIILNIAVDVVFLVLIVFPTAVFLAKVPDTTVQFPLKLILMMFVVALSVVHFKTRPSFIILKGGGQQQKADFPHYSVLRKRFLEVGRGDD